MSFNQPWMGACFIYAVFVLKGGGSTFRISSVQRETVLLMEIHWNCSVLCIFAQICWPGKFDHQNVNGLFLSVDRYIQYLIKTLKNIFSVWCHVFLFGKSWLFLVIICFCDTVAVQACYLASKLGERHRNEPAELPWSHVVAAGNSFI